MSGSVLVVDDDRTILTLLDRFFSSRGWSVTTAADAVAAVKAFESDAPDIAILDVHLPRVSGLQLMDVLRARDADLPVLLITGHGDVETAVEAMTNGAETFLTKPIDLQHLEAAAERAREKSQLRRQALFFATQHAADSSALLGSSPAMRRILEEVSLVAANDSTVLLLGETGTGKDYVARLIHTSSARASSPFVELNCAGLTATFLDSELFGHERGAFTDAKERKIGLFEIANGGTLFLDEIGDLSGDLQPKLLKVLETRRFRRLGGTREIDVDVRLIVATNHDIRADVNRGAFREDLYYRIAVFPITLPPLRDRGAEDIVELASRILVELNRGGGGPPALSAQALQALTRYTWPGNVRELRNVLERALLLCGTSDEIQLNHLPTELRTPTATRPTDTELSLDTVERQHILAVIGAQAGNVAASARILGISRSALYERLKKYGVEL